MNPLIVEVVGLLGLALLSLLLVIFLILLIVAKVRKRSIKKLVAFLLVDVIIIVCSILFWASHATFYKFNDWTVLNSDIHSVVEKYGDFDDGAISEGKPGWIAYYIYTDNGPIMPDHMPHYYKIHYGENGIVNSVEDSLPMGG